MTFGEARALVGEWLQASSERSGIKLALGEAATRVEEWGWVFFYNSVAYLETRSSSDALAGNGPLVVERVSGALHELTTARPIDEQLTELRDAIGT